MHVLMVDDHLMFLQGLKNLLSVLAPDLRVDTSGDLPQALQLVQLAAYDLVLLDWHLGGGGSEGDGEASMQRLRDAGHRLNALTPRQRDVYRAAARGLPNKLIARELGIAESTVKPTSPPSSSNSACATGRKPPTRHRVTGSTLADAVHADLPAAADAWQGAEQDAERDAIQAAARQARIAERTDALCLKHMLGMGRQSYILLPSVFFIAYLAVREGAVVWAGVWFVAWVARMVYVYRLVGRLRSQPDAPAGPALAAVVKGYVFAGVVAGGLMPVFFARSSDMVLVLVTFLVTTYGSTMMIAASGVLRAGLGYGVPTLGVLVAGWLWHGGALGYGLAAFLAMSFALSIVAIRSQRRALTEVVRVIDDNERLSAALARERDRAASVSESKTRFFAAASHDLRQPLHALSINATTLALMARRSPDELLKEVSQGIGSALRQSRGLLDGLLDISRLDANAVQTRMAAHPARELLLAVRDEFAALAAQRGLWLRVDPADAAADAQLWVTTDADQLLRILGNLVDNANKFTPQGGITLSARRADGSVLLRVSDTGPGIAETERERVFEEFYQIGNPSRDRSQGLGLGLAIVRRTAALLGTTLTLASAPGRGASFELSLPAAAAVLPPAPLPAPASAAWAPLTLLLVGQRRRQRPRGRTAAR